MHHEGHVTRAAIEEAREQVAALFHARPREVVFTSSGTESVNTAVFGALARRPGHVVTTAVEHSAVLEAVRRGAGAMTEVGVDRHGRYDAAAVLEACDGDTTLVTVQLANHEVGTLQPAAELVAAARERGITVHVDVCAAAGHVPVDFVALGADLVSVTAHKFGGPKGAGRAARPARPTVPAVARGRRAGAGPAGRHRERARHRRLRRGRRRPRRRRPTRHVPGRSPIVSQPVPAPSTA